MCTCKHKHPVLHSIFVLTLFNQHHFRHWQHLKIFLVPFYKLHNRPLFSQSPVNGHFRVFSCAFKLAIVLQLTALKLTAFHVFPVCPWIDFQKQIFLDTKILPLNCVGWVCVHASDLWRFIFLTDTRRQIQGPPQAREFTSPCGLPKHFSYYE